MLLALGLLAAAGCSGNESITPPRAAPDDSGQHDQAAQVALDGLVQAVRARSTSAALALSTSQSRDRLAAVAANARSLRIVDFSARYVDEGTPLSDAEQRRLGAGSWSGTVQLTYAFGGLDRRPARVETEVQFVPEGGTVKIGGFGGDTVRSPLWLVDRLAVVRSGRTLTAVDGSTAGRYPRLAERAVRQVRRTLPGWKGPLVIEVPGSQQQLDRAVMAQSGEYDNIAAVTTTEDGSLESGSPVRVFVNPPVFGNLLERGAQVVMSHESTHVATGAIFVSMPTWLMEGFADYVALYRFGVPVSLAAGQILPRIRKEGLPSGLPTSNDLSPTASGLGATYEEAWLACRFIGERYGNPKMVAFYEAVSGGESESAAFRSVLGTTESRFVSAWRRDLQQLERVTR